jgi:DNA-binding transcriptional ArsR family regulator
LPSLHNRSPNGPRGRAHQTSAPHPLNAARLFAALGDKNRLRLVARLCKGPESITGLSEGFPITRQAVTKHLRVMRNSGLVRRTRRGRHTIWQLNEHRLQDVRCYLDLISKQWDDALARLRTFVER